SDALNWSLVPMKLALPTAAADGDQLHGERALEPVLKALWRPAAVTYQVPVDLRQRQRGDDRVRVFDGEPVGQYGFEPLADRSDHPLARVEARLELLADLRL